MQSFELPVPQLKPFARSTVQVAAPWEVGSTFRGQRRVIPIIGGQFQGDGWTAKVLAGGADFQLIVNERMAELDARYALETDAGDLIYVVNHAIRTAAPETMAKLIRGELVAPQEVYFRCRPQFETSSKALGWINERMFLGTGRRLPDCVQMEFFEVM
ncbi:MAG: DUF3237 domain-containing protein [Comamonas sp.]